VIERLALAADQLPTGVHPAVAPLASALTTILAIGLRGPDVSPLTLRDLADWTIRPRLLAVPGVANVVVYGGGVRQIQITTSPERLWSSHRSLDDVALAAAEADAGSGSGFIDRPGQRLPAWLEGRPHGPSDGSRPAAGA
jgi:Cu/Ag efflux pump CusA